jgi:hypothetical protein
MMSVGRGLEVGRGRRNDEGVCYNSLQTGGGRTKSKRRGTKGREGVLVMLEN